MPSHTIQQHDNVFTQQQRQQQQPLPLPLPLPLLLSRSHPYPLHYSVCTVSAVSLILQYELYSTVKRNPESKFLVLGLSQLIFVRLLIYYSHFFFEKMLFYFTVRTVYVHSAVKYELLYSVHRAPISFFLLFLTSPC